MAEPASGRAPWWRLLERDQIVLYALCVLMVAVACGRYAWSRLAPARHVQKLESAQRIDYRVDLNQAGVAELDLLPGIGPAKARRIVQHRLAHGPFRAGDDLAAAAGLSRDCIERLRGLVTPDIGGPQVEQAR